MPLKTGRTNENAQVTIDEQSCTVCGLCVKVCKGGPLYLENGKVHIEQTRYLGCLGCGQCVAVCPRESIQVTGRDLAVEDIVELPTKESRSTYEQLQALMLSRRSIREFKDQPIPREVIDKIINGASTAPMGIPPSDVEVLLLEGRAKVSEFAADMVGLLQQYKWMFSPGILFLLQPFIGKENTESFRTFVAPLIDFVTEKHSAGIDGLLYHAPLAMYFHTSPYSDPADPLIAATYGMLSAHSLGVGSCMIGSIAPFLKYSPKLKQKYGIPLKNRQGIMVIFGYPALRYQRALKRRLAKVHFYEKNISH